MSLCVETPSGQEVFALKEIGVKNSIGIFKKASKPLVISGEGHRIPFANNTFDFIFSGGARLDKSAWPSEFAFEITRTLKPEGFLVAHVKAKDKYSFNSFLDFFDSCELVKMRHIDGSANGVLVFNAGDNSAGRIRQAAAAALVATQAAPVAMQHRRQGKISATMKF
ncbi:hypothetical protein SLEP1_g57532 [Rubroshorea leprosula]|uniref:Methyltransferase type 11 domain-containing protein n=1 Tax=Rubroshorea leprosula TaxID=152421 RepID=A0AAV5MNZ3_9ROSI|nr:hypothetical protein SLEP1_g57532 [Rubroshorea leprosula]